MYSLELHFTRWCSIYFSRQNALPSLGKTNEIFVDIALAHKKNLLSAWFVSIAFFLQKNLTIHIRPAKYIGCCEISIILSSTNLQVYFSLLFLVLVSYVILGFVFTAILCICSDTVGTLANKIQCNSAKHSSRTSYKVRTWPALPEIPLS